MNKFLFISIKPYFFPGYLDIYVHVHLNISSISFPKCGGVNTCEMAAVTPLNAVDTFVSLLSYGIPQSHANTALCLGEVIQVVTCL